MIVIIIIIIIIVTCRSGSFGSGRSTPYSKRSGPIEASSDHLMELDFGGEPQHGRHGLGGR